MFLSHKSKYSTFLSADEIENRFNHMLTESMISNEQKFSGYFDKHYFVINDNEPSKFGEPATIEGRILETLNRKTVIEITTIPRNKSLLQIGLVVLILLNYVIFQILGIFPTMKFSITGIITGILVFFGLVLFIRFQYYSLKRTVISTLQLEKS